MAKRQVGHLDLPALVIQPDQLGRRVAAVIGQRGNEPVMVPDPGPVGAGDEQVRLDDPHREPVQLRQVRAVVQELEHRRLAGAGAAAQQLRPGPGDRREQPGRVIGAVGQHQHALAQQRHQLAGQRSLITVALRADHGAEQSAGPGLGQGHHPQRRVPGQAQAALHLPQPRPVPLAIRHLDRVQAVERDRAQAPVGHSRSPWPRQRDRDSLEQGLHRGGPDPSAKIPQRLLRGPGQAQALQRSGQLVPHPQVPQPGEQRHRQQEVHPHPRGQHTHPPLRCPGDLQYVIDQLKRQVPGQLTQMPRSEHPGGDRHRARHGDHGRLIQRSSCSDRR